MARTRFSLHTTGDCDRSSSSTARTLPSASRHSKADRCLARLQRWLTDTAVVSGPNTCSRGALANPVALVPREIPRPSDAASRYERVRGAPFPAPCGIYLGGRKNPTEQDEEGT